MALKKKILEEKLDTAKCYRQIAEAKLQAEREQINKIAREK